MRYPNAFTLPEMVMAASLTAILGLAVATVAFAVSSAHSQTDQTAEVIQSSRVGLMAMDSYLRKAKLITAASGAQLTIWTGDANNDRQINPEELVLIAYNAADKTVEAQRVTFPANMAPATRNALNASKALYQVDAASETSALLSSAAYSGYLSKTVLATNVQSFSVTTDAAAPYAKRASVKLTVALANSTITLSDSAVVRADAVNCVKTINSLPVLKLDSYISTGQVNGT